MRWLLPVLVAAFALASPRTAQAQGDEIQVYDGGLAPVGVFNLTVHNNFTPKGLKTPEFAGAVTPNRSLNGVPEWAYGVTNWFEAGLYLPLYSRDQEIGWKADGFKPRTLFAVPNAASRAFFYGVNIEYSYNAKHWDTKRFTSEIRPIVGWHVNSVDLVFNPILDTRYDGLKHLEFAPSTRVAYNASPRWAVALEEYAGYGEVHKFEAGKDQSHQLFGVVNYNGALDIEAGLGFGLTDASDRLTFKVIVAKDLNKTK